MEQGATEGQAVMNRHSGQHGEADGDDEVSEQRQSFAGLEGRALDRALDQGAVLVTFANDAGHSAAYLEIQADALRRIW